MNMTTEQPPTDTGPVDNDPSYWHSKRTIAATLVLVSVAGAVAWAATTSGGHDHAPAMAAAAACGPTSTDTTIPKSSPPTQWVNTNGWDLAISATDGPTRRSDTGAWSCYSRTPIGALMAAWDIDERIGLAKDYATVVQQQVAPGAGQAALLKRGQEPLPLDTTTPMGFRVDSWTESAAQISFWVHEAGRDFMCPSKVQWSDANRDWLLSPEVNGDTSAGCQPTTGVPAGTVKWGPRS